MNLHKISTDNRHTAQLLHSLPAAMLSRNFPYRSWI